MTATASAITPVDNQPIDHSGRGSATTPFSTADQKSALTGSMSTKWPHVAPHAASILQRLGVSEAEFELHAGPLVPLRQGRETADR